MKNLLNFLKKFRDFLVFLFLQVFILSLFFNSKNYHKASFINSSSSVSGWMLNKRYGISKHFLLETQNDSLAHANAYLLENQSDDFYHLQNRIYSINDSLYEQQYEYIPATVINSTTNKRNNYITVNIGSLQGIEKEMGVISTDGIVGFVVDVSSHYSVIKTILSDKVNISVKLLEQKGVKGQIKWDGRDNTTCQLHGVTSDTRIEGNETVITRSSKGIFPEGIKIGTISNNVENNGSLTLDINIKLSTNFNTLSTVYIVNNLLKTEQLQLEKQYFHE
jgi:rod shape-determining protein MreC